MVTKVNNGNLNYDGGDVFSATQKIYIEIDGTLNGSTGVKIIFYWFLQPSVGYYLPYIPTI